MDRRWGWVAVVGMGAFFAVHIDGCSLIGLTAGAWTDSHRPAYERLRGSELVRVTPGTQVSIMLHDSTWVRGIYRGPERIAEDEYRVTYDAWRARHPRGATFPEIGESVKLDPGGKGVFQAFVAEGVDLKSRRRGPTAFDGAGWLVRHDGSRLAMLDIRDLALAGELPIATALRVETSEGEQLVAVDRVAMVDLRTARHAARDGFIVGLVADVVIVAVAKSGSHAHTSEPGCTYDPSILSGFSSREPASDPAPGAARRR